RLRDRARPLLQGASALARGTERSDPPSHPGADLAGRDLRGTDLRAADLRGALLIGADLRGTDLRRADVIGADLRAADVRGADLGTAIYLTQFQVAAARGDARTRLPPTLSRPPHWAAPAR
ncbi:pentapeptide repeat-containing protein, partial [Angustibacter peucedani]